MKLKQFMTLKRLMLPIRSGLVLSSNPRDSEHSIHSRRLWTDFGLLQNSTRQISSFRHNRQMRHVPQLMDEAVSSWHQREGFSEKWLMTP